ncbi:MAG: GIY-YIG nuclease family protein [Candidatus Omnitrophota bacterium]|nr:GIY-YIG nuclease family protein [Candidatus Omnitrophota bacterium]
MWHVYIIQCADDTPYTGTTTDIPRRVNEHNSSKGGNYTRIRNPVKLVYKEDHPNRSEALKREAQIKRWTKQKKLALITGDTSSLHDLSKSHD